jgi:hypothetical protein
MTQSGKKWLISLPSLSDAKTAETLAETVSLTLEGTPLKEVLKTYESLSGTLEVYETRHAGPSLEVILSLKVNGQITKNSGKTP